MNLNWLYGPPSTMAAHDQMTVITRSKVLDTDTLADIAQYIRDNIDVDTRFYVQEPYREVPDGQLSSLSSAERNRLILRGGNGGNGVVIIDFGRNQLPGVLINIAVDPKVHRDILHIINTGGPSMIRWSGLTKLIPFALFAALLGAWVWVILTETLSASWLLFGNLVVVFGLATAVMAYRTVAARSSSNARGHRIRNESRAETLARRADTHKDAKVAVITAAISIAVTLIVTILTGLIWPASP